MYKVLLADDEPVILKGLARLINWEDYGLEISGFASNGEQAWKIVSESKPDILITDIRMPRMDGLELLRKISDEALNIKTIVISGYDDFSYVKKALGYGIENYLLKPINEEELSSTILNAVDKLDSENNQKQILQYGIDTLLDNIINRWLSGGIDPEELKNRAEFLAIDIEAPFYLLVLIKFETGDNADPVNPYEIRKYLRAKWGIAGPVYITFNLDNEFVILLPFHQEPDIQSLHRKLEDLFRNTTFTDGLKWNSFIGYPCTDPFKLKENYRELKRLQVWLPFLPSGYIVDKEGDAVPAVLKGIDFSGLDHFWEDMRPDICFEKLDGFFSPIKTLAFGAGQLRALFLELVLRIIGTAGRKFRREYRPKTGVFNNIERYSVDGLHEYFRDVVQAYIDFYVERMSSANSTVKKMCEYVKENYRDEVSLKTMSRQFNMSASYLGQLFKQETGLLFTDYLCDIRIEKAKSLLEKGIHKQYSIAEMVGFKNPNYFANVFKKKTGVYPSKYKTLSR
jgi:two-component system response regulator YesN